MQNTYQTLLTELQDGILTITINRADKMNALNAGVIGDLSDALDEALSTDEIKAIMLTGAGEKAFVAGADISEFDGLDATAGSALAQRGADGVFNKIEQSTKPVVAAVNGFSLGGGCELAMACHFRTASETARFGQPEVNLGLIPGYGGTQRLTRLVGRGRATEMLLTGDMVKADEALRIGLVNKVFAPVELLEETRKILAKIISKAPLAVAGVLECVQEAAAGGDAGFAGEITRFGNLFETADMKEGTGAFMEKRAAQFTGK